jgi:phenylacetate-CoA ligase
MNTTTCVKEYLHRQRDRLEDQLNAGIESSSQQSGQEQALRIFHQAATRVPAYQDFLKQRRIDPDQIQTYEAFEHVPTTDKSNYLDQYPLEDLVWDGDLCQGEVIHSSSGTTGQRYFWPCSAEEMNQAAAIHEFIYRRSFALATKKTLLLICFSMGSWIAGSYTLGASRLVSQKGYGLTIMTPGWNKEETLKVLDALAPKFQQTIIAGIPSFVKDLLDGWSKAARGTKDQIKLLLAGEGFTEGWRDHVLGLAQSENPLTGAVSILGSADAGLLGFETPRSILVRRWAAADQGFRKALFGYERLPALLNYVPTHRFFEGADGELLVTASRCLPLVRYNTHDRGGVLSSAHLTKRARQLGFSLDDEAERSGPRRDYETFPFVYVFGRGSLAATLYGVNIYAEYVQEVLVHEVIGRHVTGRFTLETKYVENQDQCLEINVELAEKNLSEQGLAACISEIFIQTVRKRSSEYARLFQEFGTRAAPRISLYPYGAPEKFPQSVLRKSS